MFIEFYDNIYVYIWNQTRRKTYFSVTDCCLFHAEHCVNSRRSCHDC